MSSLFKAFYQKNTYLLLRIIGHKFPSYYRHESNADSLYNLSMERDTFQKGVKQLSPTFAIVIHRGRKLTDERKIDNYINFEHDNRLLKFKHIGHTMIYGNHFTLKTYLNDELVSYDGIRNPKIQIDEQSKFPSTSRINFIAFILLP